MSLARMIMMVITSLEEILLQGIFFVANSKILLHTVSFSSSHVQLNITGFSKKHGHRAMTDAVKVEVDCMR